MKRMIGGAVGILLLFFAFGGRDYFAGCSRQHQKIGEEDSIAFPLSADTVTPKVVVASQDTFPGEDKRGNYPRIEISNRCKVAPKYKDDVDSWMKKHKFAVKDAEVLCEAGTEKKVCYTDQYSRTILLTSGHRILLEAPVLTVCPLHENEYIVENAAESRVVHFANPQEVEALGKMDKRDPRFSRYAKEEEISLSGKGQTTLHTFTLDFPSQQHPHAAAIRTWLARNVSSSHVANFIFVDDDERKAFYRDFPGGWSYNDKIVTPQRLNDFSARRYFEFHKSSWKHDEAPDLLYSINDYRLRVSTDRFVSYQYSQLVYDGLIFENYVSQLMSYDFIHQKDIDLDYLFKPGTLDSVKSRMLDELMYNRAFHISARLTSPREVYQYLADGETKEEAMRFLYLPYPGLSEKGVVFSFCPSGYYCFLKRCVHIVIPYGRLLPYLTDEAKWCLNIQ